MAKITSNIGNNSTITKTSQLINDGEDSTSEYVEVVNLSDVAISNDYNDLDNIPMSFPPSSHTHNMVDVDGTKTQFNNSLTDGDFLFVGDIHSYFKGVYLTLSALNLAHPTASAGDYAQVNEVGSTSVVNYNWDAEDGIWVLGGSGGSGASNTDALPEGTSNFYFTTARVLATLLTGISFLTGGAIVSTDSILIAFGKIQKNITDIYTALTLKQDATVIRTGNAILFDKTAIYNSFTSPTLSQLSSSLTGAKLGIIQKIYIQTATFSAPSGWKIQGSGVFTPNVVNIIYAEWADATTARVEYWIELAKV